MSVSLSIEQASLKSYVRVVHHCATIFVMCFIIRELVSEIKQASMATEA